MTYTYADLEISQAAYDEIKLKLANAGYLRAFETGGLDMNGIRLSRALMAEDRPHLEEDRDGKTAR